MTYTLLPLTDDPYQVFTLDASIDGAVLHARFAVRYLPAPGRWFLSLWDNASGEALVNAVPLVASVGAVNDLFTPFRYLREGKGVGSLFCLRGSEELAARDPAEGDLSAFHVLFGDTWERGETDA